MSYTGPEAARIVGISYRQVDYWERTGLVQPSLCEARGSGSRRGYSYRDLVELRIVKAMLDAGMTMTAARFVIHALHSHSIANLPDYTVVISSDAVRLVDPDELVEVVRSGTGMLNVLPLAGVMDALDGVLHHASVAAVAG